MGEWHEPDEVSAFGVKPNGVCWGYVHVTFDASGYESHPHQIIQDTSAIEILSTTTVIDGETSWNTVNVAGWKPRTRHTAAAFGGNVVIVGGTNLDPSENTFPIGTPVQRTGGDMSSSPAQQPYVCNGSDYYGTVTPAISEFFAPGTWNGIRKNDVWLPATHTLLFDPQSLIPDLSANVFLGEKGGPTNNMEGWVFDPSAGYATSSSAMTIMNNKMFLFGGRRAAWAPSSFHFITTDASNSQGDQPAFCTTSGGRYSL